MKAIILLGLIAAISAAPTDKDATVVKEVFESNPDTGSYKVEVETSNGIKIKESGNQVVLGDEQGAAAVGSFSYTAPDGTVISLSYKADENGFQPVGAHLPVAPTA